VTAVTRAPGTRSPGKPAWTFWPDAEVLAAYRYQPNLARRGHLLKAVQQADPVLLHDPARIEALFCCQFLALLIGVLIEREIRTAMANAATRDIPLYPELRACPVPLPSTSWRSSPTSLATSYAATASSSRPSK